MLELKKIFKTNEDYLDFLKRTNFSNMTTYPIFVYRNHFLSEKVVNSAGEKYKFVFDIVKDLDVEELKIA